MTHPGLARAFRRGVRFAQEEGVFVVQLGRFRGQIEVEDTPFFVDTYDPDTGEIELSDRSSEPLDPGTLSLGEDGALRCTVKTRFRARFTHAAQAHLLTALDTDADPPTLRCAGRAVPLRGLGDPE